jgi:uncharacterized damage-inducible protein DinB
MPIESVLRARLLGQSDAIMALFAGLGDEATTAQPLSGKWSLHQHLCHLGRYHEVFLERLDRILHESSPKMDRYRAEDDPQWGPWMQLSNPDALERFRGLRTKLIRELDGCSSEDWARTAIHSALGEMTLRRWLDFFLVHEAHHLYNMMFTKAAAKQKAAGLTIRAS